MHPVVRVSFLKTYHEDSGELSRAPPSIQTQFDHQIDDILGS